MQPLKVTLIQTHLAWLNPAINRQQFTQRMTTLAGQTDLIVLPEMFTTGFTMEPEQAAESADGPTLEWMQQQAAQLRAALVGSVAVAHGGHFYNRLYWVQPDGVVHTYDKRHLFRMAGEHQCYAPGVKPLLVEWRGWRICPLVCYDLRFPVWSRRRAGLDYDVLLYVANWPAARRLVWQTLLSARAIENASYCIGVNCVGIDGKGVHYSGDSAALNFKGEVLQSAGDAEWQATVTLDAGMLVQFREKFPVHLDADKFQLL